MSQMLDSVLDVINRRFDIPPERVVADASFDDLGLDSLSQIELITALQKQLGVRIDDEEIDGLSNLTDVVDLLERKVAA
jgi:acyl carrier protein